MSDCANRVRSPAEIAQLVEHRSEKPGVPCSIHGLGTLKARYARAFFFARVRSVLRVGTAVGTEAESPEDCNDLNI